MESVMSDVQAPRRLRERLILRLAKVLRVEMLWLVEEPEPTDPGYIIRQLKDSKDHAYIWILQKDEDPLAFGQYLQDNYMEFRGKPPEALHLFVHGIDDIQKLSKAEVKVLIRPWLEK